MKADSHFRDLRSAGRRSAEPGPGNLVPFGPYGAGQMTGHPIGLVIVIFMLFMSLPFLVISLPLGAICGLLLGLRHRKEISEAGLTILRL
jgi:hypothetical protein